MRFDYTEKKDLYEYRLYRMLKDLQSNAGVLIGEPSLTKLFHFISGYEYAIMEAEDYRLHFHREYQAFISRRFPEKRDMRWDQLLMENRTESEAFSAFYYYLGAFFKEYNINIYGR